MAAQRAVHKVPLHQNPLKFTKVEEGATRGATIGVDVLNEDGSLFVPAKGGDTIVNQTTVVASGGGTATPYTHTQAGASAVWNIPHNLGHRPVITLYTSGWVEFIGQVTHTDANNTIVNLDSAQAGYAVLI